MTKGARFARRTLGAGLALVALVVGAHVAVGALTEPTPPAIAEAPALAVVRPAGPNGPAQAGRAWTTMRGKVRLVRLAGTPEQIGTEHATLLRDRMVADEQVLWDGFEQLVPIGPLRTLLFDVGRVRYRHVDSGFPDARRREVAAEARAFAPDPYARYMPTYPRMVMLHALYDVALGFERSPLLGGCTSFGVGPQVSESGHALFARAFDFEVTDVFDDDKAVFLVEEEGRIPFVSIAWPGFVGVVSGMNAKGVGLVVHGGRAREPRTEGVPVAFSMREVLATAEDADAAAAILAREPVMVSHIVMVGDARGKFLVVERAPGEPAFVRSAEVAPGRAAVTNHFEGPLAGDPRDAEVRRSTTTLARRARIDELLRALPDGRATPATMLELLRDHRCAGGESCKLGDRRAIDAFIATHGFVADLTSRTLWVSEGPRLSGRFVKIDVGALVSRGDALPDLPAEPETLPADEVLSDGRYGAAREVAGGPLIGGKRHAR